MGFKERLKEKRLEAGLTQAELAEKGFCNNADDSELRDGFKETGQHEGGR